MGSHFGVDVRTSKMEKANIRFLKKVTGQIMALDKHNEDKKRVKLSLYQAMEAHRVVRR
jgi:hypothetical protein